MKKTFPLIAIVLLVISCKTTEMPPVPLKGTWQLVSATLIENNDTTTIDYTKGRKFLKIINDSHFSFLHHDLKKGVDSPAIFSAGGGSYTLRDSIYTEYLEFCSDRAWEHNEFSFTVSVHNDTLVQKGYEKVEGTGIDRLNMETYVRAKTTR